MTDREIFMAMIEGGTWLQEIVNQMNIDADKAAMDIGVNGEFRTVVLIDAMKRLSEACEVMKNRSLS